MPCLPAQTTHLAHPVTGTGAMQKSCPSTLTLPHLVAFRCVTGAFADQVPGECLLLGKLPTVLLQQPHPARLQQHFPTPASTLLPTPVATLLLPHLTLHVLQEPCSTTASHIHCQACCMPVVTTGASPSAFQWFLLHSPTSSLHCLH